MKRLLVILLLALQPAALLAREGEPLQLSHGLACRLPEHQRRAMIPADPVEALVTAGKKVAPMAGDLLVPGEKGESWKAVTADSTGWFSDPTLRNGWVHFRITRLQPALFLLEGMGNSMVYVNGTPRIGNRYRAKDQFESWEPRFDYGLVPIRLDEGENHLLFRCSRGRLKVVLHPLTKTALFNPLDLTLPDLRAGEALESPGGIVVLNGTNAPLGGLFIRGRGEGVKVPETPLPELLPLGLRKVAFPISAAPAGAAGELPLTLTLLRRSGAGEEILDETVILLRRVEAGATHRITFISGIDGSVQYYAVNPASGPADAPAALFLSLHGANVEGANQAASYSPKSWGHIVAPTNRRPYGHNWEDWGRMDALEVLDLARRRLKIDTTRIYLTGHSMGGHGTWHLGATFPDYFAAIGPSAGWISFWSYGVRDTSSTADPALQLLRRASTPSNTFAIAGNYSHQGVYIIHGSKDDNVRVDQSRRMVEQLETFHHDWYFHEQPEAGHWWDLSDAPGADCVDWMPLFDFFARHARPGAERMRRIDFTTANPGISARSGWLTILDQEIPLAVSRARIEFNPSARHFQGSTENIARLALRTPAGAGRAVFHVELDSQRIDLEGAETLWLEKRAGRWSAGPALRADEKGPHRYGPFKEAFNQRMIFVYGTRGSATENRWALQKARFDAESFWYQGNGSVDVVADVDFNPDADRDRSVVLYGNSATNAAWKNLLAESPIQVRRSIVQIGKQILRGDDLAALFIQPRPGSDKACVAVIAGTAPAGMRLTQNLPYLYAGAALPDFTVLSSAILRENSGGVAAAGFFDRHWRLDEVDMVLPAPKK